MHLAYHPDPDGHRRYGTCGKKYARVQDLKAHRTRTDHKDIDDVKTTKTTTVEAAKVTKRKSQQSLLPKVMWGLQTAKMPDNPSTSARYLRPEDHRCQTYKHEHV